MTDDEHAILMAIQVMIDAPSSLNSDEFLIIARRNLQYAFETLKNERYHILPLVKANQDIANAVLTVDWEYLGTTRFLKHHELNIGLTQETQESRFILTRLTEGPEDFDNADLWTLRRMHFLDENLRIAVVRTMAHRVTSFAQRILAGPLEISGDLEHLKQSIRDYGFSSALNEVLGEVDKELEKPASAFDQVGTMQHIRSFFEKLHLQIGEELRRRRPSTVNKTPLDKCGKAIEFLCQTNVITEKLQSLAKSLYGILSDDEFGCHAIMATRDYTRLCRNMVVEYAVVLFLELERRLSEP